MSDHAVYSPKEELANCLTHGLAAALSLWGLVLLLFRATATGDPYRVVACAIFGSGLSIFYLISTLYHSARRVRVRRLFRILDHAGIFVVIAGTYTPFTLVSLRAKWGWLLFGVVWTLALAGIVLKSFMTGRLAILGPLLYLALGWLIVVDSSSLLRTLTPSGFGWLVAGGLSYTCGVAIYAVDRIPFNHAIWHLLVMAGSLCHYLAVLWYVVPLR